MRTIISIVSMLFIVGCGAKKTTETAPVAEPEPQKDVAMPDSAEARAFAKLVVENDISDWSPTGSRDFKWVSADFKADGSLKVSAKIEAGGEVIECPETGTWSIDSAESKTSGIIEWTIAKTSCATRDDGNSQRVQLSYSGTTAKISFR